MFSVELPTFQFRFTYRISQALFDFSSSSFEARRFTWALCIFLMTPLKSIFLPELFLVQTRLCPFSKMAISSMMSRLVQRHFLMTEQRASQSLNNWVFSQMIGGKELKSMKEQIMCFVLMFIPVFWSLPAFSHRQDYIQTKDSIKDGSCFTIQTNVESDCEPERSPANNLWLAYWG